MLSDIVDNTAHFASTINYFKILKNVGTGSLLAVFILMIRPYYEFFYNRRKYTKELSRIQNQLSKIPFLTYLHSSQLTRIGRCHGLKQTVGHLDRKILPYELWEKLRELDIPDSRAIDYLNEIVIFRVQAVFRLIEKQEVEFSKYLNQKKYLIFSFCRDMLKHLVTEIEKNRKENKIEGNIEFVKEFNMKLFASTNHKRIESHPYYLRRWPRIRPGSYPNENLFPVFNDVEEYLRANEQSLNLKK